MKTDYVYNAWPSESVKEPVYDADTVRLTADLGFGMTMELGPCRLYGINAPEMRGPERERGILARDYLRELLGHEEGLTIRTRKDRKGKYGRYLVEIYTRDGLNVNEALVDSGHAVFKSY